MHSSPNIATWVVVVLLAYKLTCSILLNWAPTVALHRDLHAHPMITNSTRSPTQAPNCLLRLTLLAHSVWWTLQRKDCLTKKLWSWKKIFIKIWSNINLFTWMITFFVSVVVYRFSIRIICFFLNASFKELSKDKKTQILQVLIKLGIAYIWKRSFVILKWNLIATF